MPTFRIKNLTMSLGEQEFKPVTGLPRPDLCIFPSQCNQFTACNNPSFCLHPTDRCQWPSVITCITNTLDCWTHTITNCFTNTCGVFSDPCTGITNCGPAWSTLPPTTFNGISPVIETVKDPDVLITLREQLDEAMGAIKERGIKLEKEFAPQSLAQAEALEKELKAALDELKSMKKGLK